MAFSPDLVTSVFGWAGVIATLFLVFIPLFMIYDMFKTKNNSRVTYLLFILSMLNNFFWFIYGFIIISYQIIVTNSISGIANTVFLCCYIAFIDVSLPKRLMLLLSIGVLISIALFIGIFFIAVWDKKTFGIITVVANCLLFIGPIQKIMQTFKERDRSYIPIEIVVAFIINSIIWVIYGICLNKDVNIIIPNALGLVLMILECCVWCYFYYDSPIKKSISGKDVIINKQKTIGENEANNDNNYNDKDQYDDLDDMENKPFII